MSLRLVGPKPKATESAVQGKIIVVAEDGAKIGQWGGTECYLSRENALGPCLVVTSISNRKRCTYFSLLKLHRVLCFHASAGKLTVMMPHERRGMVSIFIETATDVEELRVMAATLQDRRAWAQLERNVSKRGAGRGRGDGRDSAGGGSGSGSGRGVTTAVYATDHALTDSSTGRLAHAEEEDRMDGPYMMSGAEPYDDVDPYDDDPYAAEAGEAQAAMAAAAAAAARKLTAPSIGGPPAESLTLPALAHALENGDAPTLHTAPAPQSSFPADGHAAGGYDDAYTARARVDATDAIPLLTCTSTCLIGGAGPGETRMGRAAATTTSTTMPSTTGAPLTRVWDALMSGASVFLSGPPGSGKTTLATRVARAMGSGEAGLAVAITAASPPAALIVGGSTLHHFAGAPDAGNHHADRILTHRSLRYAKANWLTTDLLVVVDIHEISAGVFGALAELGRRVRHAAHAAGEEVSGVAAAHARGGPAAVTTFLARPFGGLRLLLVGDFLSTPPPPPPPSLLLAGEEVLPACASAAWPLCELQSVWLPAVMSEGLARTTAEEAYRRVLEDVRLGDYTVAVDDLVQQCLGRDVPLTLGAAPVVQVVGSEQVARERNRARLAAALEDGRGADDGRPVHVHTYSSADYAAEPGADVDAGVPLPATLTLCVGAPVMLLVAAEVAPEALVPVGAPGPAELLPAYGSIGIVKGFAPSPAVGRRTTWMESTPTAPSAGAATSPCPVITFFSATNPDLAVELTVSPVCLAVYERAGTSAVDRGRLLLSRTQVPLRLAYALPVTALRHTPPLPRLRVRLDTDFFAAPSVAHGGAASTIAGCWGLALLALSRAATADALWLDGFHRTHMREAVSEAALQLYQRLCPAEVEAAAVRRAADAEELERRRRARKSARRRGDRSDGSGAGGGGGDHDQHEHDLKRSRTEEGARAEAVLDNAAQASWPSPAAAEGGECRSPREVQKPRAEAPEYEEDEVGVALAGDSMQMTVLTQASAASAGTELWNSSQVRTMVRALLMDDEE